MPRRRTPRAAIVMGGLGWVVALVSLALAWRVEDPSRAVWARVVGIFAATALPGLAASLAVAAVREPGGDSPRWPVDSKVVRSLLWAALVLLGWWAVKRLR